MTVTLSVPLPRAQLRVPLSRRQSVQSPRLSVVIVNYHRWENTAALVQQLTATQTMRRRRGEVLIVDNHSPNHPQVPQLRRRQGVALRRWRRNRGFAQAVNEGFRLCRGEWLLLLNPDMSLPDGFLDKVLRLTSELNATAPQAGVIGLGLRNSDGAHQLSAGPFPTLGSTLSRLVLPRHCRKYQPVPNDKRSRVDWVTGCNMLIRRACFEDLGGLDPDYFLYYEDVDFCRRCHDYGWSVWYEPNVEAIHHHPIHRRPVSTALRVVTRHSLLTYARKHWTERQFHLLARIIRCEAWARRLAARHRGHHRTERLFDQLSTLTGELTAGDTITAHKRIQALARNTNFYALQ